MAPQLPNRWLSATASLIVYIFIVAELALGAGASRVPQELMEKARREGGVRVIVQLAVDAAGGSPHDNETLRAWRRGNIAEAQNSLRDGLRGLAHRVHHQFRDVPSIALELDSAGLQTLDSLQGLVSQVFEDKLERSFLAESAPLVQANPTWAGVSYDGSGTVVAILDTGVDKNHPFLGNVVAEACFSSNVASYPATSLCPGGATSSFAAGSALPCSLAGCYHGTHVAGIATGDGQNGAVAGFSGVAKGASVMAVQVFSRFDNASLCGSTVPCVLAFTSDIMAGLQRVYDLRSVHNFASVNMSLGGGGSTTFCDSDPRKPIIDLLRAANIATVIASGNNGFTNQISAPACISSAVSVGSTLDTSATVSSFSNSASFLSLLAPGELIFSSIPGGVYTNLRGTSMATPHVAGAFAILKQAMPALTVSQALAALQAGGLPVLDTRNGITKPRIRILDALLSLNGDAASPSLSIASHSNNQTVMSAAVTIAGTASDSGLGNNGISSVTVNGTPASGGSAVGSATANWSRLVTLNPGSNIITVIAKDNSASQNSRTVQINLNYQPADIVVPAAVTNLAAGSVTANSVLLSWSAPGDDGNSGTATSYDIRYRLSSIIDVNNWGAALQAVGEPAPLIAGSAQSFSLTGLSCGTTYFFALRSADEVPNLSAISNSPSATTLPCAASIQVTAPNGGEVWAVNSRPTIRWISSNLSGNVSIQLSRNGGSSWATITSSTANDGARTWQVSGPATTAARIRVCSVSTPALCDASNANFTIR